LSTEASLRTGAWMLTIGVLGIQSSYSIPIARLFRRRAIYTGTTNDLFQRALSFYGVTGDERVLRDVVI
jgi:hypothetical protein